MRRARSVRGTPPRLLRGAEKLRRVSAGWLLFALPVPLLLRAIFSLWSGDAAMLGVSSVAFLLLMMAAMLTRRGLHQELDAAARPLTGGRRLPLKTIATAILAVATGFTAFAAAGQSGIVSLAYAIGAAAGYVMLYGSDLPNRRRLRAGAAVEAEQARGVLAAAYERVAALEQAARALSNREFRDRLGQISLVVRQILSAIEANPADLRRARKFLNVYLDGAQQVAGQYVRTEGFANSPEREQNFRTLLVDIENTCHEQYERLLQHDVLDLDVQIEVLTARLRREGVS
jgi:5-bromo-4-chloroindolyl phosphate hydrolysis protein.